MSVEFMTTMPPPPPPPLPSTLQSISVNNNGFKLPPPPPPPSFLIDFQKSDNLSQNGPNGLSRLLFDEIKNGVKLKKCEPIEKNGITNGTMSNSSNHSRSGSLDGNDNSGTSNKDPKMVSVQAELLKRLQKRNDGIVDDDDECQKILSPSLAMFVQNKNKPLKRDESKEENSPKMITHGKRNFIVNKKYGTLEKERGGSIDNNHYSYSTSLQTSPNSSELDLTNEKSLSQNDVSEKKDNINFIRVNSLIRKSSEKNIDVAPISQPKQSTFLMKPTSGAPANEKPETKTTDSVPSAFINPLHKLLNGNNEFQKTSDETDKTTTKSVSPPTLPVVNGSTNTLRKLSSGSQSNFTVKNSTPTPFKSTFSQPVLTNTTPILSRKPLNVVVTPSPIQTTISSLSSSPQMITTITTTKPVNNSNGTVKLSTPEAQSRESSPTPILNENKNGLVIELNETDKQILSVVQQLRKNYDAKEQNQTEDKFVHVGGNLTLKRPKQQPKTHQKITHAKPNFICTSTTNNNQVSSHSNGNGTTIPSSSPPPTNPLPSPKIIHKSEINIQPVTNSQPEKIQFLSFSRELSQAANRYPDTVVVNSNNNEMQKNILNNMNSTNIIEMQQKKFIKDLIVDEFMELKDIKFSIDPDKNDITIDLKIGMNLNPKSS